MSVVITDRAHSDAEMIINRAHSNVVIINRAHSDAKMIIEHIVM